MKRTLLALGLIGAVVAAAAWAGKAPSEPACGDRGLLLKIAVPDGPQKAGEALPMKFSVTNTGPADAMIPIGLAHAVSEDAQTKMPAVCEGTYIICQTEQGDFVKYKGHYAFIDGLVTALKPGEELQAGTVDLSKCFDLKPGKYEVQLLFARLNGALIDGASNRVSITIH
jgi:hypothetical protein